MIAWLKEHCFSHLEKEKQKNNLLLFVIAVTYSLADCNVLLNHPFVSPAHLIFFAVSMLIFITGYVLNRIEALVYKFKYIMMTLLLLHAMSQVVLFNELPAVYQVLYFYLAITLIYLNGGLTLYVGVVSLLFTLSAGILFKDGYFPYLDRQTLNIPLGILAETTVVLWASTKIGTSFSRIMETKERLGRLLQDNETQLRIIEKQNKTLKTYIFQVEALAREEERIRALEENRRLIEELASTFLLDDRSEVGQSGKDAAIRFQQRLEPYIKRLMRSENDTLRFSLNRIQEQIAEFEEATGTKVEWRIEGEQSELSMERGAILQRAVSDFLIQATMYRHATLLEIVITFQPDHLLVTMTDNGDESDDVNRESALSPLVDKVKEIRGELEWKTFRGKGSVLTIKLPNDTRGERKISVIVADPDPFIRESIGLILGKENDIEVVSTLNSGREVLDCCERLNPDVVLMELELPDLNGIETAKQLKSKDPNAKVIILTRLHEIGSVAEAIEAGVDAYLLKSTNPQGLGASIRYMMDGGTLLSRQTTALLANQAMRNHQLETIEKKYISQAITQEYGLKEKEVEILGLLAQGSKYKQIANALFLSEGTVRNYLSVIYAKLNVEDRYEAVDKAVRLGIVSTNEQAGYDEV